MYYQNGFVYFFTVLSLLAFSMKLSESMRFYILFNFFAIHIYASEEEYGAHGQILHVFCAEFEMTKVQFYNADILQINWFF